jgi:hypothetical protein
MLALDDAEQAVGATKAVRCAVVDERFVEEVH